MPALWAPASLPCLRTPRSWRVDCHHRNHDPAQQPCPAHLCLTSLPLLARGKVRDNYAVGDDRILMVASDRLSAFDVIMGEPIPGKGELLTQMALFWFDKLGHICPNHLTGDAPKAWSSPRKWPRCAAARCWCSA